MMFWEKGEVSVKICGVTTAEQAREIARRGADAIGLNFYPGSKRYIAPEKAASWAAVVRSETAVVGVFVEPTDEELRVVVDRGLIDVIQLHGHESPSRVEEIKRLGLPVIKAIQVKDAAALDGIGNYAVDAVLLDSYNPDHHGGEGRTFEWELAVQAKAKFPTVALILAGGLRPENVARAVRETGVQAVDVATGVESGPGVKDLSKVEAFIRAARSGPGSGAVAQC